MTADRWSRRSRRPGWYTWVAVVLLPIAASIGVLIVSLHVNARTVDRERMARHASEQAACQIWVLLDDIYRRTPPTTEPGRALAKAVANLRVVNNCPPRKEVPS